MDGVLCNFTEPAIKKAKKLFDVELDLNEIKEPSLAQNILEQAENPEDILDGHSEEDTKQDIYKKICNKGFFLKLKPFEGAVEAVINLANAGARIIFITKPLNWDKSSNEKYQWLENHFSNIDYEVIMVDSPDTKALVSVDVMIDDDPRCLEAVENRGMTVPCCIERPWNKEFRDEEDFGLLSDESLAGAIDKIISVKHLIVKELELFE